MTWEEFRGDWRKQMLGERLVEVLGEAVKRLPNDLRQIGIRNCLGIKLPARGIISPMAMTAWTTT